MQALPDPGRRVPAPEARGTWARVRRRVRGSRGTAPGAAAALVVVLAHGVAAAEAPLPTAGPVRLEKGYRIEPVVAGLSAPTALAFDGTDMLLAESGLAAAAPARLLRVGAWGGLEVEAEAGLQPPVTGLLMVDGVPFVSHRGAVVALEPAGARTVAADLPSGGDHGNNQMARGPDGRIYLGQGTVTNAGVVGLDNHALGWLAERPELHDVPCRDVVLVGQRFETEDPRVPGTRASTGAFRPFGSTAAPGEVARGRDRCGGSIVRFWPSGEGFELVAWGLRNPFGLRFDARGRLFATSLGADVRGSRAVFNDPDLMVRVREGAWYGWPDFFDGEPADARRFAAPDHARPRLLWQHHPPLARAFTTFRSHTGASGFDFAPEAFGFAGQAFVAAFGDLAPFTTGAAVLASGFRVLRVDMSTGRVWDFARNAAGDASEEGGLRRPVDAAFGPDGALYVVDFGLMSAGPQGLRVVAESGAVWRIFREERGPAWPRGPAWAGRSAPSAALAPATRRALPAWAGLAALLVAAAAGGLWVWRARRRQRSARRRAQAMALARRGEPSRRERRSAGPS
jgi:glucose/arabinose dehydrogenase